MAKFAASTEVSVEQSKVEIERVVGRYGASGFMSGWSGENAMVQFVIADRHVRFNMTLPARDDKAFTRLTRSPWARSPEQAGKLWEQACRQKWRSLLLLVKAKLEAVDAKITTFEESFFAHVVMPDGRTVYESAREHVALAYQSGQPVPLLPRHAP